MARARSPPRASFPGRQILSVWLSFSMVRRSGAWSNLRTVRGNYQGGHALSLRSVRRVIASAGIIGAAMLVLTGSALPVQAAPPSVDFGTNGFVGRIINHDGQCLDMRSTATDAQLQVEPCNGSLQQEWDWVQVGSGGPYLLKNERWGRCPTIL